MKKGFRYLFVASVLIMAGCNHNEWIKPGATAQDFNIDKFACMQNAMTSAPAAVGNSAAWNNGGGSANVGPYGGNANWSGGGGAARSYDLNAKARNQLTTACLQAKGWQLVSVPDAPNTHLDAAP